MSVMLSLTKEQVQDFARDNQFAMEMINTSVADYAACRCCLINGLLFGLILGQQTVEKLLKAQILLLNPAQNPRKFSHHLMDLTHKVESLAGSVDLKGFYPLIDRLQQYYQARYPDNPNQPNSMTTAELTEIDELVVYLNERLSMPDEVKYRSGIYARLFTSKERNLDVSMFPEEIWLNEQNKSITSISDNLEKRYFEVRQHLYPTV